MSKNKSNNSNNLKEWTLLDIILLKLNFEVNWHFLQQQPPMWPAMTGHILVKLPVSSWANSPLTSHFTSMWPVTDHPWPVTNCPLTGHFTSMWLVMTSYIGGCCCRKCQITILNDIFFSFLFSFSWFTYKTIKKYENNAAVLSSLYFIKN